MVTCSRCKKRPAVVFLTKYEGGETKQEGLCIPCARELGIKPVDDIIKQMGLSDEDLERMEEDIQGLMESLGDPTDLPDSLPFSDSEHSSDNPDGRAPVINFQKIMRDGMGAFGNRRAEDKSTAKDVSGKGKKERKHLDTYCTNLTAKAAAGKLDCVIGRERDLGRVIQILCRRQKNNPCLIGEPGVGKTAIAEALAQKIVSGDVPYALKKCEVYLLDLTALVAGTQFRGQFESRVLALLNEVKAAGNIILVIDEVHNIVGAGDAEGSMNAANMLKPALSRGEIQVIGATTLKEYRKHIEKDSALERRFQPVMINEPGIGDTEAILRGIKHYYEEFHGINIPDSTLAWAVRLSERYITDRFLPDKAIDLIDEAASHISLSSSVINERREALDRKAELDRTLSDIENKPPEADADAAATEAYYRNIAGTKAEILRLSERISELEPECKKVTMEISDLADVIEIWTGIPASTIKEDEFERLEMLEKRVSARVIGQDKAVSAVARAVRRRRAGISPARRPVSFIFAGPTGVGKTELVKVLAEDLFATPDNLVRLDMSEYMDKFSVSRIIGSPPGYVGYDDAGQLTERIRRHPYSVVLFDEIEKAHPDVMNIMLQILDDGKITDSAGREVNFENTVIVMTTNAGALGGNAHAGFTKEDTERDHERTMKALSDFLRPEFINRVDEIITFRHLEKDDFKKIACLMLDELKSALSDREIAFVYTDDAALFIGEKSYSIKYGARNMRRYIQTEVENLIASEVINTRGKLSSVSLLVRDGELSIESV